MAEDDQGRGEGGVEVGWTEEHEGPRLAGEQTFARHECHCEKGKIVVVFARRWVLKEEAKKWQTEEGDWLGPGKW